MEQQKQHGLPSLLINMRRWVTKLTIIVVSEQFFNSVLKYLGYTNLQREGKRKGTRSVSIDQFFQRRAQLSEKPWSTGSVTYGHEVHFSGGLTISTDNVNGVTN